MMDYVYYEKTYCGDLIEREAWPYYAKKAEKWFEKIQREYRVSVPGVPDDWEEMPEEEAERYQLMIDEAVGSAVCAIAEVLYSYDNAASGEGGPISSAKIGSVSVSYGSAQGLDLSADGERNAILDVASLYLDISWGKVVFL